VTTFKILLLMKRRPGMSVEAFRDYYENRHVPLALKYDGGAMTRYVRRYLEPQPNAELGMNAELPYDVVSELWFEDEAAFRATLHYMTTSVMPDDVVADEMNLFDRPTMRIATVIECETDLAALRAAR
jgi:uncharacterized protein (TIGR02118 family)